MNKCLDIIRHDASVGVILHGADMHACLITNEMALML
jgi:hypothetical protein